MTPGGKLIRVAAAFALVGFVTCFVATQRPLGGDGKNYGLVARSLLADGDIRLDEFRAQLSAAAACYGSVLALFLGSPPALVGVWLDRRLA